MASVDYNALANGRLTLSLLRVLFSLEHDSCGLDESVRESPNFIFTLSSLKIQGNVVRSPRLPSLRPAVAIV